MARMIDVNSPGDFYRVGISELASNIRDIGKLQMIYELVRKVWLQDAKENAEDQID